MSGDRKAHACGTSSSAKRTITTFACGYLEARRNCRQLIAVLEQHDVLLSLG